MNCEIFYQMKQQSSNNSCSVSTCIDSVVFLKANHFLKVIKTFHPEHNCQNEAGALIPSPGLRGSPA